VLGNSKCEPLILLSEPSASEKTGQAAMPGSAQEPKRKKQRRSARFVGFSSYRLCPLFPRRVQQCIFSPVSRGKMRTYGEFPNPLLSLNFFHGLGGG
jgi:hypothetical protein